MKLVHGNHLGFIEDDVDDNFCTIHVDDWNGSFDGRDKLALLCGTNIDSNSNYYIFTNEDLWHKLELCKTCTKKALKTGRCLVTTISAMKLKRI